MATIATAIIILMLVVYYTKNKLPPTPTLFNYEWCMCPHVPCNLHRTVASQTIECTLLSLHTDLRCCVLGSRVGRLAGQNTTYPLIVLSQSRANDTTVVIGDTLFLDIVPAVDIVVIATVTNLGVRNARRHCTSTCCSGNLCRHYHRARGHC